MPKKKDTDKDKKKLDKPFYYEAVGRRRAATARVRFYTVAAKETVVLNEKKYTAGDMIVNGKAIAEYFSGEVFKRLYTEPFRTTNTIDRFFVSIVVTGGGPKGQLGATVHGISRALLKVDTDKFRPILKKKGLLTRDPRKKQRRKAGFAQKSRARKQSPKR